MVDYDNPLCDYAVVVERVKKNATEQIHKEHLEDDRKMSHHQGFHFHFHNLICQRQEYEDNDQQINGNMS